MEKHKRMRIYKGTYSHMAFFKNEKKCMQIKQQQSAWQMQILNYSNLLERIAEIQLSCHIPWWTGERSTSLNYCLSNIQYVCDWLAVLVYPSTGVTTEKKQIKIRILPLEAALFRDIYYWFLVILYIEYIFVKCLNLLKRLISRY